MKKKTKQPEKPVCTCQENMVNPEGCKQNCAYKQCYNSLNALADDIQREREGKRPAQPFDEKLIRFTQEEIDDIEERRGVFEQIKAEGKLTKEIQLMEVLARVGDEGKSLRRACAGVMTRSEFYKELDANEELEDQYTRACEDRFDLLVESTLDIAADNSGDLSHIKASKDAEGKLVLEVKENREFAARSKVKIDAIQWYLTKVDRARFGNKVELDGELKEDIIIHLNLGAGNDVDDPKV